MAAYSAAATAIRSTALRRLRRSTASTIGPTPRLARIAYPPMMHGRLCGVSVTPPDEIHALHNRDRKVTAAR